VTDLDDRLAIELERAQRSGGATGLVLIDIDNFKLVNDMYGHPQGDLVLHEVERGLRESSREIDYTVRDSGGMFAVILPRTDLKGALDRAEGLRAQLAHLRIPRFDGSGELSITASCGVASAPPAAADPTALVQAAFGALQQDERR
jgi:diguanylate cyclase (GGDEF)-like protein